MSFDEGCRRCPRLARFLDQVKADHPTYHARPVVSFGDPQAQLLIVGLAPGMHGANATGRPFTGDFAGILLYETLYQYGFSDRPQALRRDDGLQLHNCRITNAVKCLPPQNKPVGAEINNCNEFLREELAQQPPGSLLLALGGIAHKAVVKAVDGRQKDYPFRHAAEHALANGLTLLDSYHCSRYNTQTRRLTPEMFQAVFVRARELLSIGNYAIDEG